MYMYLFQRALIYIRRVSILTLCLVKTFSAQEDLTPGIDTHTHTQTCAHLIRCRRSSVFDLKGNKKTGDEGTYMCKYAYYVKGGNIN